MLGIAFSTNTAKSKIEDQWETDRVAVNEGIVALRRKKVITTNWVPADTPGEGPEFRLRQRSVARPALS